MPRCRSAASRFFPAFVLAIASGACGNTTAGDGGLDAASSDSALRNDSGLPPTDSGTTRDARTDASSVRDGSPVRDVATPPDAPVDVAAPDVAQAADAADVTSAPDGAPATLTLPGGSAHLTFDDEFESGLLDPAVWNRWYVQPATINNELEFYAPDAFEFGQGVLRIRADRRAEYGFDYTSGAITTYGSFSQTYGYFEIRAQLPRGNGLWPAFWMLAQDQAWPPEIDVFENLGQDPTTVYTTYHWKDSAGMHQGDGLPFTGPDYSAGMHTYAVDWRPGLVVWYLDGVEQHRVQGTQVTNAPMYLLANLAVGGSWPVPPDNTTTFPAYYDIDYVRAYQYDSVAAGAVVPITYATTTADAYTASPGATVNFDVGVQVNTPPASGGLIVQAILYDNALQNQVTSQVFMVNGPIAAGPIREHFAAALPAGLAPGIYRLSVGVFHDDWSFITWLANASVITVR